MADTAILCHYASNGVDLVFDGVIDLNYIDNVLNSHCLSGKNKRLYLSYEGTIFRLPTNYSHLSKSKNNYKHLSKH